MATCTRSTSTPDAGSGLAAAPLEGVAATSLQPDSSRRRTSERTAPHRRRARRALQRQGGNDSRLVRGREDSARGCRPSRRHTTRPASLSARSHRGSMGAYPSSHELRAARPKCPGWRVLTRAKRSRKTVKSRSVYRPEPGRDEPAGLRLPPPATERPGSSPKLAPVLRRVSQNP